MVGLMTTVPNNVHTMSPFIDGLVESSANLGVVSVDDDMVRFTVFARSSVAYHATQIGVICGALANSFGFTFDSEGHVPGWAVNPNSKPGSYTHLWGSPPASAFPTIRSRRSWVVTIKSRTPSPVSSGITTVSYTHLCPQILSSLCNTGYCGRIRNEREQGDVFAFPYEKRIKTIS